MGFLLSFFYAGSKPVLPALKKKNKLPRLIITFVFIQTNFKINKCFLNASALWSTPKENTQHHFLGEKTII